MYIFWQCRRGFWSLLTAKRSSFNPFYPVNICWPCILASTFLVKSCFCIAGSPVQQCFYTVGFSKGITSHNVEMIILDNGDKQEKRHCFLEVKCSQVEFLPYSAFYFPFTRVIIFQKTPNVSLPVEKKCVPVNNKCKG